MKIAVLGGLGYLGSVISDELNATNDIVVYDCGVWGKEDIPCKCKIDDRDVLENNIPDGHDAMIWSIDIDVENFYNLTESQKYIDKNLSRFKEESEWFAEKFVFITHDYKGTNLTYSKFLNDKFIIAKNNNNKIWVVPELFGPSSSMRFDTLLNDMFASTFVSGGVFIQDWLRKHPVCSVACLGKLIAKDVQNLSFENNVVYPVNCCLSLIEYANIIKKIFKDKCEIILSDDYKMYKYDVGDYSKYKFYDFGEFTIQSSFEYMIKGLSKGMIEDITKDYYNNSRVIENYVFGKDFFKFVS